MDAAFACLLDNRGVIRLGGADRRAFLQGLISNDINLCSPERAIYAALLTPQGKFLHDLFIIEDGEEFLIDCEANRSEDLLKRLAAYKLRAKVKLSDTRNDFEVWTFENQNLAVRDQKTFPDPRLPEMGWRAIVEKNTKLGDSMPFAVYDRHRVAMGVADGSRDLLIEKSTLAEGNLDLLNGISFTKGCYVGQELTARMHYRSLAKKRLFKVTIEGATPPFGSIIKFGKEEDIGDMRSHCANRGLALLNVEKAETAIREKAALACCESKLTVSKPEWMQVEKKP